MKPGKTIYLHLRFWAVLFGIHTALIAAAQMQKPEQKNISFNNRKEQAATNQHESLLQANKADTVPHQKQKAVSQETDALYDTTFTDYDEIFNELDALLDSLYMPRSFAVVNAGMTSGYFNYSAEGDTTAETQKQLLYSASLSYFDKSGLGLSGGASLLNYNGRISPFQFSVTGSYDYIRSRHFITGVAYSHYFTKDDLPFYTSPLQNEVYGYFTYRKLWFKPSVGINYGWGTRQAFEEREKQFTIIKKKKTLIRTGTEQVSSVEQIADLSVNASVRHDFFLLHPFGKKDYFRITPQISLMSGTQQFGFNQTTTSSLVGKGLGLGLGSSDLVTSKNASLESNMDFRPMSLTTFLKTEYVNSKFFIQPQVALDYYFPAKENNLTASFLINAGLVF